MALLSPGRRRRDDRLDYDESAYDGSVDEPVEVVARPVVTQRARLRQVGRVVLWALIALLLFRGVMATVSPSSGSEAVVAPRVDVGPTDRQRATALSFARDYLSFDSARSDDRLQRLQSYTAVGGGPSFGEAAPEEDGPVITVGSAEVAGWERPQDGDAANRALVHVEAELLRDGKPVGERYLSVPTQTDQTGAVAVYDLPAYVNSSARLANTRAPGGSDVAGTPGGAELEGLVNRFMPAYLAGGDLTYFVPPGDRLPSAAGDFELASIDEITDTGQLTGSVRLLDVTTTVRDQTTQTTQQVRYTLGLQRRDRWLITYIEG